MFFIGDLAYPKENCNWAVWFMLAPKRYIHESILFVNRPSNSLYLYPRDIVKMNEFNKDYYATIPTHT